MSKPPVRVESDPHDRSIFGAVGPTPLTPVGLTALWALVMSLDPADRARGLADVTLDPAWWKHPERIAEDISGRVIARAAVYNERRTEAQVRILPEGLAVEPEPVGQPLPGSFAVDLVLCPDAWWRVARFTRVGAAKRSPGMMPG